MAKKRDIFGAIGGIALLVAVGLQVAFWGGTIDPRGSHQLFAGLCGGYLFGYLGTGAIHLFIKFLRRGCGAAADDVWGFIGYGGPGWIPINVFVLIIMIIVVATIIFGPIIGEPSKIVLVGILIGNIAAGEFTIPLLETRNELRLQRRGVRDNF